LLLHSVEKYDIKTDQLLLKHNYPHTGPTITASVNINLVRETLKNTVLQVGAWVNVVGYVMDAKLTPKSTRDETVTVKVQAIMLWDTVALNLQEYESAVQARRDAGTTG
jgi:short-subunit dehydrogenase